MGYILPAISFILFLLAMYFRAKENSITLFQKYGIPQKKVYQFAIPINEIKKAIVDTDNAKIRNELKRCLSNRMYFWYSFAMVFLSIIIPSIVKGIILAQ